MAVRVAETRLFFHYIVLLSFFQRNHFQFSTRHPFLAFSHSGAVGVGASCGVRRHLHPFTIHVLPHTPLLVFIFSAGQLGAYHTLSLSRVARVRDAALRLLLSSSFSGPLRKPFAGVVFKLWVCIAWYTSLHLSLQPSGGKTQLFFSARPAKVRKAVSATAARMFGSPRRKRHQRRSRDVFCLQRVGCNRKCDTPYAKTMLAIDFSGRSPLTSQTSVLLAACVQQPSASHASVTLSYGYVN